MRRLIVDLYAMNLQVLNHCIRLLQIPLETSAEKKHP